jgi:predicted unusual protein kinase regulating ubiquinone biosynthesis (AarF/ABC1/UbiB family)
MKVFRTEVDSAGARHSGGAGHIRPPSVPGTPEKVSNSDYDEAPTLAVGVVVPLREVRMTEPAGHPAIALAPAGYGFHLRRPSPADLARRSATVMSVVPAAAVPLLRGGDPRRMTRRDLGRILRVVAQRLGGTWVKVGQVLASAPGLVGEDLSEELRPLLDTSPPVPIASVRRLITRGLGRPVDEVFASIDAEPIGTGSLAIVHRGVTRSGREVAVKVLRPAIERDSSADLVLIETLLDGFARWRGIQPSIFRSLIGGLRQQLSEEMDLRREADHMDRFRALFDQAGLEKLVVPEVDGDLSARRVLTMEFLDGWPSTTCPPSRPWVETRRHWWPRR